MEPRQLELMRDARLSDSARILGLHLSMLGEGEHEMSFDQLATLLHGSPQTETVGKHMRQLCIFGYAERTSAGGRGSPRYRWVAKISAPKIIGPEQSLPRKNSAQSPTVVVDEADVKQIPPIVPPLDERTENALNQHGKKLEGCRGALRDYLRANVPTPTRRYAYVHTIATWLDGGDPNVWRLADGSGLPPPERPAMLAAALNELAAGDEAKMKRPAGDPANLRTKINVLLKQRGDHERRNGGTGHHDRRVAGQGSGGKGTGGSQAERRGRGFVNDESDGD